MKHTLVLVFCIMSLLVSCNSPKDPLIIGHRGARGHVAENTIPSIEKALALGVDGIEIDIFKCATGELVVFHDKTLEKLTNATGYIEELSLDSIQKITVLNQAPIPTLGEVLDIVNGKALLNIDLKGTQTALPTVALLESYVAEKGLDPKTVFISSFDWNELEIFYQAKSGFDIAVLTEDDPLNALVVAQNLDAIAINPNYKSLTSKNVKQIQKAGFKVYPWTVNAKDDIEQVKALGVDGIITDFPERIH